MGAGRVRDDKFYADGSAGGIGYGTDELDAGVGGRSFVEELQLRHGTDLKACRHGGREEEIDDQLVHLDHGEDVRIGRGDGFTWIAFDLRDNSLHGRAKGADFDLRLDFSGLRVLDREISAGPVEFL